MELTLSPELEKLVTEKLRSGEYRSAEDVVYAALQLFKEREEDRTALRQVSQGGALPADDRFHSRLELLLQEAEQSGELAEMTEQDWDDIRRDGTARLTPRKPA